MISSNRFARPPPQITRGKRGRGGGVNNVLQFLTSFVEGEKR